MFLKFFLKAIILEKEGDRPTALKAKDVSKVVSFILDSCSNYCIDQVSLSSLLE